MAQEDLITRWPGIESNPDVMTNYAAKLGLDTSLYRIVDGLDEELLVMLPQPLFSLILCIPSSSKAEFAATPSLLGPEDPLVKSVFFLEQISALDDACGTIAMIHSILNNRNALSLTSGPLMDYFNRTEGLVKQQNLTDLKAVAHLRGVQLASDKALAALHTSFSEQGQTETVESGQTGHHFICFTQIGDYVVEIDGCKPQPRFLEKVDPARGFLSSAADVIKRIYFANPNVFDFSLVALSANPGDD